MTLLQLRIAWVALALATIPLTLMVDALLLPPWFGP